MGMLVHLRTLASGHPTTFYAMHDFKLWLLKKVHY
jgi:hypothetical protein